MDELNKKLTELIATALECDAESITPDMGLGKHYKWDSLGHVAVIVALEKQYGIEINDSNIGQLLNFIDIKNYIQQYANK
jgi:acyl carrier protein